MKLQHKKLTEKDACQFSVSECNQSDEETIEKEPDSVVLILEIFGYLKIKMV